MTGCDQQQHNEIKDGTVKTGEQEGGVWELRRQTGWYEAPWSPRENGASNGAFVFMIQERRAETRGLQSERSLQGRYHAVWGTALQRRVPVCVALGFSGWYILIIPHMHTFTVQDAQFVISFSKVQRSNMPRPRRGDRPQSYTAQSLLLQSVVSHCRFLLTREVFDGLPRKTKRRKSHLKKKRNWSRDGKRSAMYRFNCPVKTKTTAG